MSTPKKIPHPTHVDLNCASAPVLRSLLPGVGDVLAARIEEHRISHGPFQSAVDLARVPGMGAKRADRLWNSLRTEALLPPDPVITTIEEGRLASDAPPGWFQKEDVQAETTVPPEPHSAHLPSSGLRRGLIALGVVGSVCLMVAALAFVRSLREAAAAQTRVELDVVRRDVANAQLSVQEVRAAQAGSEQRGNGRFDALSRRLDDHDRRVEEAERGRLLLEKRAKKIEDSQGGMMRKVGQLEDGLLWQKLLVSAQLAKKKTAEAAATSSQHKDKPIGGEIPARPGK